MDYRTGMISDFGARADSLLPPMPPFADVTQMSPLLIGGRLPTAHRTPFGSPSRVSPAIGVGPSVGRECPPIRVASQHSVRLSLPCLRKRPSFSALLARLLYLWYRFFWRSQWN